MLCSLIISDDTSWTSEFHTSNSTCLTAAREVAGTETGGHTAATIGAGPRRVLGRELGKKMRNTCNYTKILTRRCHLFKLLDLRLLKHGEHVGVGSLRRPPLGFLGGLLGKMMQSYIFKQIWCQQIQSLCGEKFKKTFRLILNKLPVL